MSFRSCEFESHFGHFSESGGILLEILIYAKIAQLVEHDLAKVGVAGSSPVFRSIASAVCPDGGIGRRATLRG